MHCNKCWPRATTPQQMFGRFGRFGPGLGPTWARPISGSLWPRPAALLEGKPEAPVRANLWIRFDGRCATLDEVWARAWAKHRSARSMLGAKPSSIKAGAPTNFGRSRTGWSQPTRHHLLPALDQLGAALTQAGTARAMLQPSSGRVRPNSSQRWTYIRQGPLYEFNDAMQHDLAPGRRSELHPQHNLKTHDVLKN